MTLHMCHVLFLKENVLTFLVWEEGNKKWNRDLPGAFSFSASGPVQILPEIGAMAATAASGEGSAPDVTVAAVGLGSVENARKFAELLNFPLDLVYCDPSGAAYEALGFSPGFAPEFPVNPYLKLFPMLAGIGSPGTIQEVSVDRPMGPGMGEAFRSCVLALAL